MLMRTPAERLFLWGVKPIVSSRYECMSLINCAGLVRERARKIESVRGSKRKRKGVFGRERERQWGDRRQEKQIGRGGRPSRWWRCTVTEILRLSIQYVPVAAGESEEAWGHSNTYACRHTQTHTHATQQRPHLPIWLYTECYPTLLSARCVALQPSNCKWSVTCPPPFFFQRTRLLCHFFPQTYPVIILLNQSNWRRCWWGEMHRNTHKHVT